MWTSARANKLDNLDTQISTKAAQSTLDSINAKIDLLSTSISNNSGGGIKCVYRGYVDETTTEPSLNITLPNEINTSKSFLIINATTHLSASYKFVAGEIVNSKTICIYYNYSGSGGSSYGYNNIYWQVVEFN